MAKRGRPRNNDKDGASKKRSKNLTHTEDTLAEKYQHLKDETISWILIILFVLVFVILILAALGLSGMVGNEYIYPILSKLFGRIGYFLLPVIALLLVVSFVKSVQTGFTKVRLVGTGLFLLASLAILDLSISNAGGIIGGIIHRPLIALFDIYASYIILIAIAIVGIIVTMDSPIRLTWLSRIFGQKQEDRALADSSDQNENADPESATRIMLNGEQIKDGARLDQKRGDESKSVKVKNGDDSSEMNMGKSKFSLKPYEPPPISLLERDKGRPEVGDIKANSNLIKRTLFNFGIIVDMDEISIGPTVTRYALKPAEGVKLSKILGLQNNLELALAAHPVRIEAPIPGKSLVGIEVPNLTRTTVGLATLFGQSEYRDADRSLMLALGKNISGSSIFANLAKMPHLLIAGATGSGKSVTVHAIINSLIFRNSPENLKFIMIDPKRVELTLYNGIGHLLTPVITDAKKAIQSLKWAAKEMDRRYDILEKSHVRDIESYHKNILGPKLEKQKGGPTALEGAEMMPYIVIIIDEVADIMQKFPRELESAVVRLAQMSRAVGIHLILSTQRPSVNVITGLIKANIPSRIALQVASQIDSKTILDMGGAEELIGAGDMLYMSAEMSRPIRLQSPFISENEVKKVADFLRKQNENEIPNDINIDGESRAVNDTSAIFSSMVGNDSDGVDDELYAEAKETVISAGKASTSYLQRKLRIGYARAARLMDILEEKGVISSGDGAKSREVLIKPAGGVIVDDDDTDRQE